MFPVAIDIAFGEARAAALQSSRARRDTYADRDIDTFVYRIPAEVDADTVLGEESEANGKYRVKKIRAGDES